MHRMSVYVKASSIFRLCAWQAVAGSSEVGGIGAVRPCDKADFELYRVWIASTRASAAEHIVSGAKYAKLALEAMEQGVPLEHLRLYWHTHPGHMTLAPSNTDIECIVQQIRNGQKIISVIFCGMDSYARMDWRVCPGDQGIRSKVMDIQWESTWLDADMERIKNARNATSVPKAISYYQAPLHPGGDDDRDWPSWESYQYGSRRDGYGYTESAEPLGAAWKIPADEAAAYVDALEPDELQWYLNEYGTGRF